MSNTPADTAVNASDSKRRKQQEMASAENSIVQQQQPSEEVVHSSALFEKADGNHDGVLNEEEIHKFLVQSGIVLDRRESRIVFLEADKDGDGSINQTEFAILAERMKQPIEAHLKQRIKTGFSTSDLAGLIHSPEKKVQIFLGGSCNPTTWRKTVVMPALEQHNITYYNPQVDDWYPELMGLERDAKETATILLFVIDNQTRAVVSMLEVAEYLGQKRRMVLTVQEIGDKTQIQDSVITGEELVSLNEARQYVSDLANSLETEVFISTDCALRHILSIYNPEMKLAIHTHVEHAPLYPSADFYERSQELFRQYDANSDNSLDSRELSLVLNRLGLRPSPKELEKIFHDVDSDQSKTIDLVEFTSFLVYLMELKDRNSKFQNFSTYDAIHAIKEQVRSKTYDISSLLQRIEASSKLPANQVYLGGGFAGEDWRLKVARPFFDEKKITYFTSKASSEYPNFAWVDTVEKERCEILLFVVAADDRAIKALVEAAYYIRKLGKERVVLVVNKVADGHKFGEHQVTPAELKDLNRGRAYLIEAAQHSGVPVFNTVQEAIAHIETKLKAPK